LPEKWHGRLIDAEAFLDQPPTREGFFTVSRYPLILGRLEMFNCDEPQRLRVSREPQQPAASA
jgi:hypothetical protein